MEILDGIAGAIGASRTAVRFSPFGVFVMPLDRDPVETFSHVISEVEKWGLAYVALTQPRTDMFLSEERKWVVLDEAVREGKVSVRKEDISLRHFVGLLKRTPVFASGNYDGKNCFEEVERGELDGVAFGRWFISNPDLVDRLRKGLELTAYKPEFFYSYGTEGYVDYPMTEHEKE